MLLQNECLAAEARAGRRWRVDAWDRLRWLFDIDDGGLYDIRLAELDEPGVVAAFEFIRTRSAVTPDALFWHTGLDRDQRVADYPDAAQLVVSGVAEPFHVLAPCLEFAGAVLPDLGVFVWPDEVTLDYRMGPQWRPPQLVALFVLLRQLVAVAGGRVGLGRHVLPDVDRLFVSEWEAYCAGCSPDAELGRSAAEATKGFRLSRLHPSQKSAIWWRWPSGSSPARFTSATWSRRPRRACYGPRCMGHIPPSWPWLRSGSFSRIGSGTSGGQHGLGVHLPVEEFRRRVAADLGVFPDAEPACCT